MCEVAGSIAIWIWGLTALALLVWAIYIFATQDTPAWYNRLDERLSKRNPISGGLGDPLEAGFFFALIIAFFTFVAWSAVLVFC